MVDERRVLQQVDDRIVGDPLHEPSDRDLVTHVVTGWLTAAPGRR